MGGIFNELSFGYKYFLGKKRIIGFRHSLFFGYQLGGGFVFAPIASLIALAPLSLPAFASIPYSNISAIAFLPYGFNTDLLINLIDDNERASQESGETLDSNALERASRRVSRKYSLGLVIGMDIGASTWFSSKFNQVKSRTIFQLQGKFGVRWNRGIVGIELGVKVPAFKVNYYSDNYGDKLDYKRVVSVYFNYTYNFKSKD